MSTLICVGPEDVERTWPLVSGMIERAYMKMDLPMPDVLDWLKRGAGLLWLAVDHSRLLGAATSSIEDRPSGKVFRVEACGGEQLDLWKHHLAEIEGHARASGCGKVTLAGRPGWERVFPEYVVKRVILEKRL